jgi:hypothetical protein
MLTFLVCAGWCARWTQHDIDIDVERGQQRQQSLCGEAGRPTLHGARDIGLRNTKPAAGAVCVWSSQSVVIDQ